MSYDLWYWTGIPGRGEFIRLPLEAGGIPYQEKAWQRDGDAILVQDMARERIDPPFAPPYVVTQDGLVISQTANILMYLGERHPQIAPCEVAGRHWVHQLQLILMDLVAESHDVHHPVGVELYYEDQRPEALRRATGFRAHRIPRFLDYFERVLAQRGQWLSGGPHWSYADLSLFHVVEGLRFAFPRRLAVLAPSYQRIWALRHAVEALPELQDYLHSERRLPFSDGLFRHYPELDGEG